MNLKHIIKQYPVAFFIITTLATSIACFALPAPKESAFAIIASLLVIIPTIVAFAWLGLAEGRHAVGKFVREILDWHVALKWVGIAFALGFALHFGSVILVLVTGRISTIQITTPTLFFIAVFPLALLEEIGWRGFALRRLLDRNSPFVATLLIGIPWALIHFGLFLFHEVPNTSPIAEMLTVFAWSFPLTWIYVKSGRNILVATVLHGALNGFGFLTISIPPAEVLWFSVATACIVDVILVLVDRRMWFSRPTQPMATQVMSSSVQPQRVEAYGSK
jgi:uncharacterized protein